MLPCIYCDKPFPDVASWKAHMDSAHALQRAANKAFQERGPQNNQDSYQQWFQHAQEMDVVQWNDPQDDNTTSSPTASYILAGAIVMFLLLCALGLIPQ